MTRPESSSDSPASPSEPGVSTRPDATLARDPEPPTDSAGPAVPTDVDLFAGRYPSPFGRYVIQRRLGRGGMGAVYLARDTTLDRAVAVKVSQFRASEGDAGERFLREARAAADLHHNGVCRVLDCGVIDGTYYITMDYVEGESLARRLAAGEPQDERRAAALVRDVALALAAVHQRAIIHRDLKPGNVMLRPDGRPCVVDFGLARREQDDTITRPGTVMGTPAYMSPEQVAGEPVTQATDIYSLGVILYQMLTGQLPFKRENLAQLTYQIVHGELCPPSAHRPDLDPVLEGICLRAMARLPGERYPTAAAFAEALQGYLDGTPAVSAALHAPAIRSAPRRPATRPASALRRRPWLVALGLLLAIGLSIGVFLAMMDWGARRSSERQAGGVTVGAPRPGGATGWDRGPSSAALTTGKKPPPPPPGPASAVVSRTTIYKYVLQSVAWVVALRGKDMSSATGTLIDRDSRLVLTNYHVVHGMTDLAVFFPIYDKDGRLVSERNAYMAAMKREDAIKGKVVAHDKTRDLAMIQLDRLPDGPEALPLARAAPAPGDEVHSLGNPGGSSALWVYSPGVVRGVYSKQWVMGGADVVLNLNARVLETTTSVNPGDSGGPCVNGRGELVGLAVGGAAPAALSLFIERTDVEDFIERAFRSVPALQGKSWAPHPRPPLGNAPDSAAELAKLIPLLASPDPKTRADGALGLALLGPDARPAMPDLVMRLGDSNAVVRRTVATALQQCGRPGPEDLAKLLPALASPSPAVKTYVLEVLTELGRLPQAAPAAQSVVQAAEDIDIQVRCQALRAVGTMAAVVGEKEARAVLDRGLQHDAKEVRAAAAESLAGVLGADVPQLIKLLTHKEPEVRVQGARALGRLDDKGQTAVVALQLAIGIETDAAARAEQEAALKRIRAAADAKK